VDFVRRVGELLAGVKAFVDGSPTLHATRITAQGLFRAVAAGLGSSGAMLPDGYGRDAQLVEDLKGVMDFLCKRYWRVRLEGAEHLPSGAALLVANHAGAIPLDGPILAWAISKERPELAEARWLVEDQIFFAPFLGGLFNRLGAVRASPEHATRLLAEKRPVLVFPEGIQGISKPFRERYQLKRFGRGGFVKIALRTSVPILPVAIVGAEETLPLIAKLPVRTTGLPYLPITPLGPIPLPAKWTLRVGAPLDTKGYSTDAAEDPSVVQELTEATRREIARMLSAIRRERPALL
jgi:1-acyl-sn-glycerol-3-phosphate acyltransferase